MATVTIRVGVLGLQGSFKEHLAGLARQAGVVPVDVRTPAELDTVAALIVPGGESTTIGRCIVSAGLLEPLRNFAKTKPIWGVCAGLILLADDVDKKSMANSQPIIGGMDISVCRNFFGRQANSSFRTMKVSIPEFRNSLNCESHFIRAPAVTRVGEGVKVLAEVDEVIVAVRKGSLLATCFHPEISNDDSWLRYFLVEVCGHKAPGIAAASNALPHPETVAPWAFHPVLDAKGQPSWDRAGNAYSGTIASAVPDSVKRGFMVFQQGGVIMDVVNADQARLAEEAGAVSVMALERIPADIKSDGGIARMSDPRMIREIMDAVTLPVMAKARIGHFAEAQILDAMNVDCIDESEVLTTADELHHINKHPFRVPFVCGAKNLGEALRRIAEGASMIRLKGNAGTGNVLEAVRHCRSVFSEIRQLTSLAPEEVYVFAKEHQVPISLVHQVRAAGRLPVVTFAAGGLATPADVSLMMQLGCDGVFVGSGIFKGENPAQRARAMVEACSHYRDAKLVARVSEGLGKGMVGVLESGEKYALTANFDSKL